MLSNLTIDKGVDLAIDTFRILNESGFQVSLEFAGPIQSRAANTLISDAVKSNPELVRYVGPVYGRAKSRFLSNIDALLFPTRYNEESWGIVLNETLAAGAPVITFDRGCTKTVVGCTAGLVVDRAADFAAVASEQIKRWIDYEGEYRMASLAAVEQATYLNQEGARTLDEFARRFMLDELEVN